MIAADTNSVTLTDLTANTLAVCMLLLIFVVQLANIGASVPKASTDGERELVSSSEVVLSHGEENRFTTTGAKVVLEALYLLGKERISTQGILVVWSDKITLIGSKRPSAELSLVASEATPDTAAEFDVALRTAFESTAGLAAASPTYIVINDLTAFSKIRASVSKLMPQASLVHTPSALLKVSGIGASTGLSHKGPYRAVAWSRDFAKLLNLRQSRFGFHASLQYILTKADTGGSRDGVEKTGFADGNLDASGSIATESASGSSNGQVRGLAWTMLSIWRFLSASIEVILALCLMFSITYAAERCVKRACVNGRSDFHNSHY